MNTYHVSIILTLVRLEKFVKNASKNVQIGSNLTNFGSNKTVVASFWVAISAFE